MLNKVVFAILFSTQLFASSVGIIEYSKSPKDVDHAALLYPKDKQICYSVCLHDQDISAKCTENLAITHCVPKQDYLDSLITNFKMETYIQKVKQHQQYETNIKRVRDSAEVNRQKGIQDPKQDAALAQAIKEADVLFNDIGEIKKTANFQNYQAVYSVLTDEDDATSVGLSIDKMSNWDQWRAVVTPFWTYRSTKLCAVGINTGRECLLHVNGLKLGTATAAKAADCQSVTLLNQKLTWSNYQTLPGLLKKYCPGEYFEIRDYVMPLATLPPPNPKDQVAAKPATPTPPVTLPAVQIPPKPVLPPVVAARPTVTQADLAKAKLDLYSAKIKACSAIYSSCSRKCTDQFLIDIKSSSSYIRSKALEWSTSCDKSCKSSYDSCMSIAKTYLH